MLDLPRDSVRNDKGYYSKEEELYVSSSSNGDEVEGEENVTSAITPVYVSVKNKKNQNISYTTVDNTF
jgi:hypothetical protein